MDVQRHANLAVGVHPDDDPDSELTALIPKEETADTSGESDQPRGITCSQIIGGSIGNVLEVWTSRETAH